MSTAALSPGLAATTHASPWWPWVLAGVFTLLNAVKPLCVDDAIHWRYASHIAVHPLDPYGFSLMCYNQQVPANHVLATPVLFYWWALAIRLFGDSPFVWKLWLYPAALLLTRSIWSISRRFAVGMERPICVATVLSPAFLPSMNLMFDVPAVALGLTALAVFFRACDLDSFGRAMAAGLIAALAMETKYVGFVVPAAMLLYALVFRRLGHWLAAASTTGVAFAGWETWIAWRYGISHFVYHVLRQGGTLAGKTELILPLLIIVGALAPTLAMFGLGALGKSRRTLWLLGLLIIGIYILLALLPHWAFTPVIAYSWLPSAGISIIDAGGLSIADLAFAALGLLVLGSAVCCAGRLLIGQVTAYPAGQVNSRESWFLILWVGLEIGGYFILSPFPATRRVLGIVVALTILVGRLAAQSCTKPAFTLLVRGYVMLTVILGFGYFLVDFREAVAEKEAVQAAAAYIAASDPHATVWYVGYWGFQIYAERTGMREVVPRPLSLCREARYSPSERVVPSLQPTAFSRGDWLVMPDPRIPQAHVRLLARDVLLMQKIRIEDSMPLRTLPWFYSGHSPIAHDKAPRVLSAVFRIRADFVPVSP